MVAAVSDADAPVRYLPKYREYVIVIDGPVSQGIAFCPWCGERLPESLRDDYFDHLETLGLEPESPELPLDLRSDAWWRMKGLG
jgi:hypothetical protein